MLTRSKNAILAALWMMTQLKLKQLGKTLNQNYSKGKELKQLIIKILEFRKIYFLINVTNLE